MARPLKRRATYDDLRMVPEHQIAQIVDGDLYAQPRPAARHAQATGELFGELRNPFGRGRGGPGGWILLFEPEIHFGGDVLVPDLAGWRRERMPSVPDVAYFELCPDWVCGVLAPNNRALDRTRKVRVYAREGVRHVWLVDPEERTLEVLRLDGETFRLVASHAGDERVRAEPFDAVEIALDVLWLEADD